VPIRREAVYVRRRRVAAVAVVVVVGILAFVVASIAGGGSTNRSTGPTPAPPSPTPAAAPTPIPGYLLIADRGNNRVLLVDGDKRVLWRYPATGATPSYPFRFDDDVFFGSFGSDYRRIITNQEDQHTIQILSFPQGQVLWHYGHPNHKGSAHGYLNTPDDAYLLPDGEVSVADAYNCRVLFISPRGKVTRQLGTAGQCVHNPPSTFGPVNGDTPLPKGGVLVSEITGSWLDNIGADGNLVWALQAPVAYPSDAQWLGHGKILVADYSKPGAVVIMTTAGKVLWRYGPASGPGMLDHPSLAMMLPNGLIAVNDDFRDRVVLISRSRHKIVWQYGHTGKPGAGPGSLHTPDGLDFLPFAVAMRDPAIRAVVLGAG
jgi:hypothetical protein